MVSAIDSFFLSLAQRRQFYVHSACVELNGRLDWTPDEEAPPVVYSLVLWPKGKHRTTLFHKSDYLTQLKAQGITFIEVEDNGNS